MKLRYVLRIFILVNMCNFPHITSVNLHLFHFKKYYSGIKVFPAALKKRSLVSLFFIPVTSSWNFIRNKYVFATSYHYKKYEQEKGTIDTNTNIQQQELLQKYKNEILEHIVKIRIQIERSCTDLRKFDENIKGSLDKLSTRITGLNGAMKQHDWILNTLQDRAGELQKKVETNNLSLARIHEIIKLAEWTKDTYKLRRGIYGQPPIKNQLPYY